MVKQFKLEELLNEKQLHCIVKKYVTQDDWQLVDSQVQPAADGIAGFLGDHSKVTLCVKVEEWLKKIHLFIKRIPYDNKPKAEFIEKNNFYRREFIMFQLFDQINAADGVMVKQFKLEELLNEKQLHCIVKKYVTQDDWQLVDSQVQPAADGIAGFLGDHSKVTLCVKVEEWLKKIHLFIKRIPYDNKPKAEFIEKNNFYRREFIMFQLFDQINAADDPNPWCARALLCDETMLVMPDLSVEGYRPRAQLEVLDMPHVRVTAASLARFHSAFANHELSQTVDPAHPYNFLEEYGHIVAEATFQDSAWLRAAAKLTANFLNIFSSKYKNTVPALEKNIYRCFVKACDSLKEYKNTLNVVNHKDLWVNNIMFRYDSGAPVSAILIDFQCIRYAPPAFDVMVFMYLNTSRSFREHHEKDILHYYYSVFVESLDAATKRKADSLGYDRKEFLEWCDKGRMFGIVEAIGIFPYTLMDPVTAQKTYDDPETYEKYLVEDRTAPVVAHARRCPQYLQRQLETAEEFLERYVLDQP